jgi:hypothetical protein
MAHESNNSPLAPVSVKCTDLTPSRRHRVECVTCRSTCPGLENLLDISPYVATLQFVELDDEMCLFLNQDWTFQPSLQYSYAQILAGSFITQRMVMLSSTIQLRPMAEPDLWMPIGNRSLLSRTSYHHRLYRPTSGHDIKTFIH